MARGSFDRLHFSGGNHRTSSGFTLLEMMIAISVMVVLAAAAAPSFSSLIESNKVKRLATEIEWLLVQAKSEAVMRGENLTIKPQNMATDISGALTTSSWSIDVTDSGGTVINKISNEDFKGVKIYETFQHPTFDIDRLNGTIKGDGMFAFFVDNGSKTVIVKHTQMTGRLVSCGNGGAYGYTACP